MSKILVIQPHRMLQQAIAIFLFPIHEVQMSEVIPESLPADDFDAVIIDAASLHETSGLGAQTMRAVREWKVPTIWIESGEASETPKWDKLVLMQRPIAREALQSALATCLESATAPKRNGVARENAVSAGTSNSGVIELVDVIEEDPDQKVARTAQKRKK